MRKLLSEAPRGSLKAVSETGRQLIQIINPGWGSSGYYSGEVLEAAGRAKVFPKGTHMYIDHQTEAEWEQRPVGSLKDLAAVLDEDARWDEELQSLVAEARVFSTYRTFLDEAKDDIGTSIRAYSEGHYGEVDGKKGWVVDALTESVSVDYVTKAGRGGKILAVMESARVSEATANDRTEQLRYALPDRSYMRDFSEDESWVVYVTYDSDTDRQQLWQQSFTTSEDDSSVTLAGDPLEVRPVTTFVPVSSAGPSTTQEEAATMATIDDAELATLRSKAQRADQLEAEKAARDTADKEARDRAAATEAAGKVIESKLKDSALPEPTRKRLERESLRVLPMRDDKLDEAAFGVSFDEAIAEAKAEIAEMLPKGSGVTGFGPSAPGATEAATPTRSKTAFGRPIQKG